MRKIFHKLHHVPSILLGIPLFIICLTGTILLFEKDVARLQNPELYHIEVADQSQPLSLEVLMEKATKQMNEKQAISAVTIENETTPYLLSIKGSRNKWAIDQYTGEVLGEIKRSNFYSQVFYMHRFFMDRPMNKGETTIGKQVVGYTTICMIIILISGLVIWVPKTGKGLKNRLSISLTKGWKRFWYDTHVAGGFYTSIILLCICLTGLYWSFSWYREPLLNLVTSPQREEMVKEAQQLAYTQTVIPGFERVQVIDKSIDTPESARNIIYAIHTGSWGGAFSKWLYAIVMFFATSFPITGYWLWWKKKQAKKKRRQ